jgi:hypothetical protein
MKYFFIFIFCNDRFYPNFDFVHNSQNHLANVSNKTQTPQRNARTTNWLLVFRNTNFSV